ncbi:MAG: hypothetical protein ACRDLO_06430 [Solirubrobacterales bacterium]
MTATGKAAAATGLWLLALGYVGLYVYCAVIGFFSLDEMIGFGIVALVLAALFTARTVRVIYAVRDHDAPRHEELMRALHRQRELRGF